MVDLPTKSARKRISCETMWACAHLAARQRNIAWSAVPIWPVSVTLKLTSTPTPPPPPGGLRERLEHPCMLSGAQWGHCYEGILLFGGYFKGPLHS